MAVGKCTVVINADQNVGSVDITNQDPDILLNSGH